MSWLQYLLLLISLLFTCDARVANVRRCPNGWAEYRRKCYYFHEELVSLKGAFDVCKSKNASLVFIRSERENNYLESYTKPRDRHWIGMRELTHRYVYLYGDLRWMDGSDMNFTRWARDEPDLRYPCMGTGVIDGYWFIQDCNEKMKAICQLGNDNSEVKLVKIDDIVDMNHNITDKIHSLENSLSKIEDEIEKLKNFSESVKAFEKKIEDEFHKVMTYQVGMDKKMVGAHLKLDQMHEERKTDSKSNNIWLLVLTSLTIFIAVALILMFFQPRIQFCSFPFIGRTNTVRLTDETDDI